MSVPQLPARATTADHGYFEDFSVGQVFRHHRGRTISEMDNYTLTLLSLNTAASHVFRGAIAGGMQNVFTERPVNGWATTSIAFGISSEDMSENAVADLGYDNVRVVTPCYHGDSITVSSEVLALEDAPDRADCGVMRYRITATKEDGAIAVTGERKVLLKRRAAWLSR